MRLVFIAVFLACALAETRLRRNPTGVRWTTEVTLAALSWYGLIVVSMLWPDWSWAMPATGAAVFIAGRLLVTLAARANPYFTPNLRQSPVIVRAGIYRYLNHPAYYGMIFSSLGIWLYFSSPQAIFPLMAYYVIIITRIIREQGFISDGPRS